MVWYRNMTMYDLIEFQHRVEQRTRLIHARNAILDTWLWWWPPARRRLIDIDRDLNYCEQLMEIAKEGIMRRTKEND